MRPWNKTHWSAIYLSRGPEPRLQVAAAALTCHLSSRRLPAISARRGFNCVCSVYEKLLWGWFIHGPNDAGHHSRWRWATHQSSFNHTNNNPLLSCSLITNFSTYFTHRGTRESNGCFSLYFHSRHSPKIHLVLLELHLKNLTWKNCREKWREMSLKLPGAAADAPRWFTALNIFVVTVNGKPICRWKVLSAIIQAVFYFCFAWLTVPLYRRTLCAVKAARRGALFSQFDFAPQRADSRTCRLTFGWKVKVLKLLCVPFTWDGNHQLYRSSTLTLRWKIIFGNTQERQQSKIVISSAQKCVAVFGYFTFICYICTFKMFISCVSKLCCY